MSRITNTSRTTRRNLRSPRYKQHGMTLIEMGVVMIIILVILGFAAGRVGGIFGKSETSEQVAAITQLIVNTKTLRSANGYGTSSTNLVPALIATESVPNSMPIQSNTIVNAWNGTVSVVSTGLGFSVSVPSVPKPACVEIANKISRSGGLTTKVGSGTAITGEVTSASAATQCSSDSNTIVFTVAN